MPGSQPGDRGFESRRGCTSAGPSPSQRGLSPVPAWDMPGFRAASSEDRAAHTWGRPRVSGGCPECLHWTAGIQPELFPKTETSPIHWGQPPLAGTAPEGDKASAPEDRGSLAAMAGLRTGDDGVTRCWWAGDDPLMVAYHDEEWGRPERRPERLFELLTLESFQSGLSWSTILRKREGFRRAFDGFDAARVAALRRRGRRSGCSPTRRSSATAARSSRRSRTRARSRRSTSRSPICSGRSRRPRGAAPGGEAQIPAQTTSRRRSRRSSSAAASASSARRPSTRSCRQRVWSTTTSTAARAAP